MSNKIKAGHMVVIKDASLFYSNPAFLSLKNIGSTLPVEGDKVEVIIVDDSLTIDRLGIVDENEFEHAIRIDGVELADSGKVHGRWYSATIKDINEDIHVLYHDKQYRASKNGTVHNVDSLINIVLL